MISVTQINCFSLPSLLTILLDHFSHQRFNKCHSNILLTFLTQGTYKKFQLKKEEAVFNNKTIYREL